MAAAPPRRHTRPLVGIVSAILILGVLTPRTRAGGYSPEEAVKRMVLPEGFHAEVFACEPMIRQPLTCTFDERGRAWVIEYLQYPVPAGLKPVTVDQYLRTEYDRVPDPPPKGPRGADRVVILEDTDGDGRADKKTVFVEGLNLASGLAVGHGGVFVGQAPYLLFYPDKNKDDKPDGDPEVLLSGFGLQDAHATVNSMQWGPDGWLYGAQGSTVTARIRGVEFQQGTWRYHPRTKQFELFAEGGGNTWGLDFDQAGNAFGSSNGAFITFHMIQGGNYWKGFAKHGPLHNPYTFGYFDAIAYEGKKEGGHVTPGGIVYKADAYPDEFRGAFIGGNLLANSVYWHKLTSKGSTFQGRHGGTLIESRDNWFRPIDLTVGPDGCVYVVDWYDKRASHLDPRDNWDKSNGRIYRVVYHERKKVEPFDLARKSSAELVALRTSPNDWYAGEARRLLAERRDPSVLPSLKTYLNEDRDGPTALRDLWALYVSGGFDDSTALGLLEHPLAGVRRWTVRLLGDERRMNPSLSASLVLLASLERDPLVRCQMAASCQRWEAKDALPILGKLARRDEDASDPHIPLMLWWAFERQLRNDQKATMHTLFETLSDSRIVRDVIQERVGRALTTRATRTDLMDGSFLLERARSDCEHRFDLLAPVAARKGERTPEERLDRLIVEMGKGLEGRRLAETPPIFLETLGHLWTSRRTGPLVLLALRLGYGPAYLEALERVANPNAAEADRVSLIEALGQIAGPQSLPVLLGLVEKEKSQALQLAAINALGGFNRPEIAPTLLALYPQLNGTLRDRVLSLLCSRKEWTLALLDALAEQKIEPKDLRPAQLLQVAQRNDPELNARVEKVWGRLPGPGSPEKIRRIAEVRGILPEGDKGDPARGYPVFKENCAVCHKLFNEGEQIGPELTGAERGNLDFLLTSLVDPSALIRKEYQSRSVALRDGRVLTGLVIEESPQTVTLVDGNRQKTVVARDQIEEMKPSAVSLMPEGLLDTLREDQVRDLFRYLQSSGPPK